MISLILSAKAMVHTYLISADNISQRLLSLDKLKLIHKDNDSSLARLFKLMLSVGIAMCLEDKACILFHGPVLTP